MAWIESHTNSGRHKKIKRVAAGLRLRRAYVLGHLHLLWHEAMEQQEDGDLSSWSDEEIAEAADYPGDAPQFVRLLIDQKLLEPTKLLHDWLDYAGKYLIVKYSTSNREKLVEIWAKHGRVYGERKKQKQSEKGGEEDSEQVATKKRIESDQKATTPNQPNQPNQIQKKVFGVPADEIPEFGNGSLPHQRHREDAAPGSDLEYSPQVNELGTAWRMVHKGPVSCKEARQNLKELLDDGLTFDFLKAEIFRKGRKYSETPWQFQRRLEPKHGPKPNKHPGSRNPATHVEIDADLAAVLEQKQREADARHAQPPNSPASGTRSGENPFGPRPDAV